MKAREAIIKNYVDAYNNYDVERMTTNFDSTLRFENITNGKVDMVLDGLSAFKEQAEKAKTMFSQRRQTIKSFKHKDDQTEIEINYNAIFAIDLPNGLKKGNELNLEGKSIFRFSGNKVVGLIDIS